MKNFILDFFTNDNKTKINTSKVLAFMILFAIANKFFNLVDKIKELIGIEIFDKIINVSSILFEFVLVITVALSLLFILSLIIFILVSTILGLERNISLVSKKTLELFLRSMLDFGAWGAVLTVFEFSFNHNYISSFDNSFYELFLGLCLVSVIYMIYEYYYFNINVRFCNDGTTKIENTDEPLKVEIVEKTDDKIKTRKVHTGLNS